MKLQEISPAEYYFLNNLIAGDSTKMLILTLQHLCIRDVLNIEIQLTRVDSSQQGQRPRLYFNKGTNFKTYQTVRNAEKTIMSLFRHTSNIPFHQIRFWIQKNFTKQGFDSLIYKDLKNANLCLLKVWATLKARKITRGISKELNTLQRNLRANIQTNNIVDNMIILDWHVALLNIKDLKTLTVLIDYADNDTVFKLSKHFNNSNLVETLKVFYSKSFQQSIASIDYLSPGSASPEGPFGLGNEGYGPM